MKTSLRHSVIVMVIKGISSIKTICHILLNKSFLIIIEKAAVKPKIKGQKSAKASKSHFDANSCEVYAPTSSITAIRVTKQITEPMIFERLVDVTSKFVLKNSGNIILKKSIILFHTFPKNIYQIPSDLPLINKQINLLKRTYHYTTKK